MSTGTHPASFCRQPVVDAEKASDHGGYSGMVRRIIKAYGRRIAKADPTDLVLILAVRDELDAAIDEAVRGMRATGFSWAEIAAPLGISKQAAQKRWGDLP